MTPDTHGPAGSAPATPPPAGDGPDFPRWLKLLRPMLVAGVLLGGGYVAGLVAFGASPLTTDVGYAPKQPVPFSHALHAGELAMDCRYCHTSVEKAAHSSIPATQTCLNCHLRIKTESPLLLPVRESAATGEPVKWVKVHDLPDFAYFNHSAHVARGVSCISCHGRVDQMEVVQQVRTLSMGWCLECHRNPAPHLRPPELVTDLKWKPPGTPAAAANADWDDPRVLAARQAYGEKLRAERRINPPQDCSTCHR